MCDRCFHQICLGYQQHLKDKKAKTVFYGFVEIVYESKCKPNKLWVDQEKEFYNNLIQKCLNDNNILMYSIHNESKSVVAKRFIKTLKGKTYKKMTANDNKSYPIYLNNLVDEYNNTYHCSIGKNCC